MPKKNDPVEKGVTLPERCWERLPQEKDKAYERFLHYLNLPPLQRTIPAARKAAGETNQQQWAHDSRLYFWAYRAQKRDEAVQEEVTKEVISQKVIGQADWDETLDRVRQGFKEVWDANTPEEKEKANETLMKMAALSKASPLIFGAHKATFGEKKILDAGPKGVNLVIELGDNV